MMRLPISSNKRCKKEKCLISKSNKNWLKELGSLYKDLMCKYMKLNKRRNTET